MSQIPLWSHADSLTVSVQPHASVQSHASTDTGSILSVISWYTAALFGHIKILHTLIGMGSAALSAAVFYRPW